MILRIFPRFFQKIYVLSYEVSNLNTTTLCLCLFTLFCVHMFRPHGAQITYDKLNTDMMLLVPLTTTYITALEILASQPAREIVRNVGCWRSRVKLQYRGAKVYNTPLYKQYDNI